MKTLSDAYPLLAQEWHSEKNGLLTPNSLSAGSGRKVWWQCEKGHEWQTACNNRTYNGTTCPYCAGKKPTSEQSLAFLYPLVAEQWDKKKNGKLTPWDVFPQTNRSVWWKCEKDQRENRFSKRTRLSSV